MLKIALPYKDELNKLFIEAYQNPRNKYYFFQSYIDIEVFNNKDFNWCNTSFVSIDKDNRILGYLGWSECIRENKIDSLYIISFVEKSGIFALDLRKFIDKMMNSNYTKINFVAIPDNPADKYYQKFVKKYNGYQAGYYKKDIMLNDRKIYDRKVYEIMLKE